MALGGLRESQQALTQLQNFNFAPPKVMTSHLDQIKAQLDMGVQALGPATGGIHGPCVHVCGLSCVRLFVSPWIVALQGPPSMEFSGKNIGVGAISSSRRIFLTRVTNLHLLRLLHCRRILYQLNNLGSHGPWDLPPTAPGSWPPQRLLFLLSTQSGCPPVHCICWNPIQAFRAFVSFKDMPLLSQQIGTLFLLKSHRSFPQLFYDIIFCLKPWLLVPYFSY